MDFYEFRVWVMVSGLRQGDSGGWQVGDEIRRDRTRIESPLLPLLDSRLAGLLGPAGEAALWAAWAECTA